nr:transposase [Legionella yabuuchiae]
MKKRYTEEQIIKAIKSHEAGTNVDDICQVRISVDSNGDYCCFATQ